MNQTRECLMPKEKIILINDKEWVDMPRGRFIKDGLEYRIAKLKYFSNRCVYMVNSKGKNVKICNGFDSIVAVRNTFERLYNQTNMTKEKVIAFIESK